MLVAASLVVFGALIALIGVLSGSHKRAWVKPVLGLLILFSCALSVFQVREQDHERAAAKEELEGLVEEVGNLSDAIEGFLASEKDTPEAKAGRLALASSSLKVLRSVERLRLLPTAQIEALKKKSEAGKLKSTDIIRLHRPLMRRMDR